MTGYFFKATKGKLLENFERKLLANKRVSNYLFNRLPSKRRYHKFCTEPFLDLVAEETN